MSTKLARCLAVTLLGSLCLWSGPLANASAPASAPPDQPNTLTETERAEGTVLLFDGKTLAGWTTNGNMNAWAVSDGEIQTRGDDGWWLRTATQYRDFDLWLDFNLTRGANSGVGIRSSTVGDPAFTGMEIQILDSFGKEPTNTRCGAVYDAVAPTSMEVKKPGEWNTYRIKLVGDTLNIWLNGVQIHKDQKLDERGYVHKPDAPSPLKDRLTTGYIALQSHGGLVRFRNLKIHDLSPDPDPGDYVPIFNAKDLTGWTPHGDAKWTVEEGTLVGRDGVGHIFTDAAWTDLEMRAQVKIGAKGNSGFYFRAAPNPDNPGSWPVGYEAQVDNHDPKNFTGCIYGKAWAPRLITRDEAWFDYRVRAVGDHLQTWVNGQSMVGTQLSDYAEGHIALQGHNPGSVVMWRDIQVRDLGRTRTKTARAAGEHPVRLFFCTSSFGYRHGVLPESSRIMTGLGERLGWLDVYATDNIAELTPQSLKDYDAVMFFTTGKLLSSEMVAALAKWLEGGGALIGVHCATDTLADSPDYVRLIGATFDGHPWNEEVRIVVDDRGHAAMRSFAPRANAGEPTGFRIADEIYQFKSINKDMHVLMHLDPAAPKAEPGRAYPLAWTLEHGKGRVFYSALGHRPEVWRDDRYIQHVLGGIRWAAHREDTP